MSGISGVERIKADPAFKRGEIDLVVTIGGEVIATHGPKRCVGPCCIHRPSEHPLKNAGLTWRPDRGMFERVCDHGIGHPDPDSVWYMTTVLGHSPAIEIHGCDGCCDA